MDKRILTLAGIILLIAAVIFGIKFSQREKCSVPDITIEPEGKIKPNQEVVFSTTAGIENDQLQWVFSDGSEDQFGKEARRYMTRPGTCVVTLVVNGKKDCSAIDSIIVEEVIEKEGSVKELVYNIDCRSVMYTGRKYEFKAVGTGGKIFLWDFGEKSDYGPKTEVASYTYTYPSTYEVRLHVDDTVFTKTVKVSEAPPPPPPGTGRGKKEDPDEPSACRPTPPKKPLFPILQPNVLKDLLNDFAISSNNDADDQLQILEKIKKMLCKDETIPVTKTNDPKFNGSIEDYFHNLQFKYREVKVVNLEYDSRTGCACKIIITD